VFKLFLSSIWAELADNSSFWCKNVKKIIDIWGVTKMTPFFENATVPDPDHLPDHSKVILGNIIGVLTIFELYLG